MTLPIHKQRSISCGLMALVNVFAAFYYPRPWWTGLLNLAAAAFCFYQAVWIWKRPL